jgi:hypothetical protein
VPADYGGVAVEDVLARISEIEALASRFSVQSTSGVAVTPFATVLDRAGSSRPRGGSGSLLFQAPAGTQRGDSIGGGQIDATTGDARLRMLATAAQEIGVAEEPSGSNDGRRIGAYRKADGSVAGMPWCATFVSWAAREAGAPIGENGQGFASVEQIDAWGRRTGRFVPPTATPRPGDIVLYGGRHVGIVESVGPGERLTTVEGNHGNRVERVTRTRAEATGYVRL